MSSCESERVRVRVRVCHPAQPVPSDSYEYSDVFAVVKIIYNGL
jgi:hypothetical protein